MQRRIDWGDVAMVVAAAYDVFFVGFLLWNYPKQTLWVLWCLLQLFSDHQ